jgi:hypothetical protein
VHSQLGDLIMDHDIHHADPDVEIVTLSPKTLLATDTYVRSATRASRESRTSNSTGEATTYHRS